MNLNGVTDMLRRTPVALAVLDLTSNRLSLVNGAFAALLRLDASEATGIDVLSMVAAEDSATVERLLVGVASGLIDSCQGRGRLRSPSGEIVDVVASIRPLDATKPRAHALLVAAPANGTPVGEPWPTTLETQQVAFGAVDHDWRFSEMSADAAALLDWNLDDCRGTPLQAVVHPEDLSLLLLTLGRSSAGRRASATHLRVRGLQDAWTPVRLAVSPLCEHSPCRFALALWCGLPGEDIESAEDRAARLEGHLWRIAIEAQAAGINVARSSQSWSGDPAWRGLSRRQSEILRRLTRGERIAAIARDLFVSQSTVRNHLAAIYRKVGVHSQSELLARVMPGHQGASQPASLTARRP
jgi:DNA-binding CsgD family transcriptional regulator/PAS domain-containing protein